MRYQASADKRFFFFFFLLVVVVVVTANRVQCIGKGVCIHDGGLDSVDHIDFNSLI